MVIGCRRAKSGEPQFDWRVKATIARCDAAHSADAILAIA